MTAEASPHELRRMRGARLGWAKAVAEQCAVLAFFVLAALVLTAPLAWQAGRTHLSSDTMLVAWSLAYQVEKLPADALHVFDAPMFYPHLRALAFTDQFFGLLPAFAPLYWITGSATAAVNLTILAALALSGYAAYLLCRYGLGFGLLPSLVAGSVFTFNHFRVNMIGHVHSLWVVYLPLALLALILYLRRPGLRRAMLFGLLVFAQTLSSIYNGLFLVAAASITWLFLAPRPSRESFPLHAKAAAGVVLAAALLAPVAYQYMLVNTEHGFQHPYADSVVNSMDVDSYLAPTVFSKAFYTTFLAAPRQSRIKVALPGFAALAAAAFGLWLLLRGGAGPGREASLPERALNFSVLALALVLAVSLAGAAVVPPGASLFDSVVGWSGAFLLLPFLACAWLFVRSRTESAQRRAQYALAAVAVAGFFLSLGPEPSILGHRMGPGPHWLLSNAPLMGWFRVPARWAILAVLGVAVLAAGCLYRIRDRLGRGLGTAAALVLVALVLYEANTAPLHLEQAGSYARPEYAWLAGREGDFAILEYPMHEYPYEEIEFLLGQLEHGKRLVNGYSAFMVPDIWALRVTKPDFPSKEVVARLRTIPFRYLVVRLGRLSSEQRQRLERLMAAPGSPVRPARRFDGAMVLEVDKGGAGKNLLMTWPAGERLLSFNARAGRELEGRKQRLDLFVNDRLAGSWPLDGVSERIDVDVSNLTSGARLSVLSFRYRYELTEPVRAPDGRELPFDMTVRTAPGSDRCLVGINGAWQRREKGYNLYCIDERGRVSESWHCNTSWHEEANGQIARAAELLSGRRGYLLVVSRYDVSRRLNGAGVAALRRLGLAEDMRGRIGQAHVALVSLADGEVLAESAGTEEILLGIGGFSKEAGFEINGLSIQGRR